MQKENIGDGMGTTKIEWCEKSWNPITGCSHSGSSGCANCYAKRMAYRLKGRHGYPKDDPFRVIFHPDRLDEPLHWKKPTRIFVCSMGDLFHDDVDGFWLSAIWSIIERCYWHTFLILTKRPERWKRLTPSLQLYKNIWLGVSVEDQKTADERIPILLQIPAAKRFISFEPLLEGIGEVDFNGIHWAIIGGETGPNARPMEYDWAFSLSEQCEDAGIPFFYKYGPNDEGKVCKMPRLKGIVWDQIPDGN